MALRYKGEVQGFEIAPASAISSCSTARRSPSAPPLRPTKRSSSPVSISPPGISTSISSTNRTATAAQYGGSFSILHKETGLFLNFGTGEKVDDFIRDTVLFSGTDVDQGQFFWAAQAGIEKKFFDLGKTTIYGEYYNYDGGGGTRRRVGPTDASTRPAVGNWAEWYSDVDIWGAGFAQGIDNAAMILYFSYRHVEGELVLRQLNGGVANGIIADAPIDDLDVAITGAIIKF